MRHRAVLARTIRPCRVIVAMPIAASSNTLWNRSTWSSSGPASSTPASPDPARLDVLLARRRPPAACVPEDADQLVDDVLERRGLGEVRRRAEVEGPHRERLLVEPAEHDDAGARRRFQHQGQGRQAVHPGHGDVQQHRVGLEAAGEVDGVGAVGALALHDRGAGQPELGPDQGADLGRVVDDHDPHRARRCRGRPGGSRVAGQRPRARLTPRTPSPSLLRHSAGEGNDHLRPRAHPQGRSTQPGPRISRTT